LPSGLTEIPGWTFPLCHRLNSVNIPNSVTYIGYNAFFSCSDLSSIQIPDNVTYIGGFAFYHCKNLTTVTIPDQVTTLDDGVFLGCTNLTTVSVGNGLTSIGTSAFMDLGVGSTIYVPNNIIAALFIDGYNYDSNLTTIKLMSSSNQLVGSGTETDPYLIQSVSDLVYMRDMLNIGGTILGTGADVEAATTCYKQMVNLDLTIVCNVTSGVSWEPIGIEGFPFKGNFNGGGYIIDNLYIDSTKEDYQGLFGCIKGTGSISNIGLTNIDITGRDRVGGLVGNIDGTYTINDCYSTGNVTGFCIIGGLVGDACTGSVINYDAGYATIINCSSSAHVIGQGFVGGLIGVGKGLIINSYSTGKVVSATQGAGGLMGGAVNSTITNTYATGDVVGDSFWVGGLVGSVFNSSIANSYATGNIVGIDQVGGLIGGLTRDYINNISISNSIALNNQISGRTNISRIMGSISENTSFVNCYAWIGMIDNDRNLFPTGTMSDRNGADASSSDVWNNISYFEYTLGWDFTHTWMMNSNNDEYQLPVLQWQATLVSGNVSYLKMDANQVATPIITPGGGTYFTAQYVRIGTTTTNASIYYTTDGTMPTTSSMQYTSSILISSTTTIKAIAFKNGMINSSVASVTIEVADFPLTAVVTPSVTVPSGQITIYGTTERSSLLQYYIFGSNYFKFDTIVVDSDNKYSKIINITGLSLGTYYIIILHPGY
ncbi:MAG: leucine-rich repeat protein, partial [Clostridiaceae bacterium]|nr:leucine-rich repeat protein [Clostridiaceae bacterium]